jgi:peptidyl-prolyl cis-trans isomerase C
LIREAQKQGITQSPAFVVRQEVLRRNLIVETYWRIFFEKHPIDTKTLNLAYEQLKAANGNKQYHMHQLIAQNEASAKQALEALARKEPFEAVAVKYSQDRGTRPQGGDLGWVWRFNLPPFAAEALAKLKPGEFTSPALATQVGFLIYKLDEVREQTFPTFEQLKSQLELTLQQQAQQEEFKRLQAVK